MIYGIFTKPIHVEKIVNFLNMNTDLSYIISTEKNEIYAYDFDIGISYSWPWKIDVNWSYELKINTTTNKEINRRAWYNYHPGLLSDYPGPAQYAKAINNKLTEFGVTLHLMTEQIDAGPILRIKKFKLESIPVNTNELGCITHYHLFQLFKETIETLRFKPTSKEDFDKDAV